LVLASLVVGASVSTPVAHASCVLEYTRAVRARFIRCESAQFYWDASGGDQATSELEREIARALGREPGRERIPRPGPETKFVAVVLVDWQVKTTPWLPPVFTGPVELTGEPQQVGETIRYLWHGPLETCEAPPPSGSSMDLWLTGPCCDTIPATEDGCVIAMSYVEPAPAPLREVLEKALEGR
jgi:hypothetical protein